MIYEINSIDVSIATSNGMRFIVNSADGYRALISSETQPTQFDILSTYDESSLRNLMNSPDWKQPCIDC